MAYQCLECGHVFDEDEAWEWREDHGFDDCYYEGFSGCPCCGGSYEEMEVCEICGEEFLPDELHGGVCHDCIEDYRYDFELCHKIAKKEKEEVNINCFLASMFEAEEIEEILLEELRKASKSGKIDCSKFIEADCGWFAEMLAKEVKKSEQA